MAEPHTDANGVETQPSPEALAASILAGSSPSPADVRRSPEYLEGQNQARVLARQNGELRAELERLRSQADLDRQAAEAARTQAVRQEMLNTLGDDATLFSQVLEDLQSDPVAAARRFKEALRVQSLAQTPPVEPVTPTPSEASMQQRIPPQQMGLGVQANTPIGTTPQQDRDESVAAYEKDFAETAARNANISTRSGVREKVRTKAVGAFLRGAILRKTGLEVDMP